MPRGQGRQHSFSSSLCIGSSSIKVINRSYCHYITSNRCNLALTNRRFTSDLALATVVRKIWQITIITSSNHRLKSVFKNWWA